MDLLDEADDVHKEDIIYPDNAEIVGMFCDMLTQWRFGAVGAYGLDYNVLPFLYKTRRVKKRKRQYIFDGIKVMEQAALEAMKQSRG